MIKQEIDQPPPDALRTTQEWFASVITHRLGENDSIQSAEGTFIAEEAAHYITPSPTLQPYQRMQIYNQQYWWRLLNTLHANFPLVTRLCGYHLFREKIGVPYLLQYPPHHWSLTVLGERLPQWVLEYYQEDDQALMYQAASLDGAFTTCFISPQQPPLDLVSISQENPEHLLAYLFYLQPYIYLFKWEYDLFTFRGHLLKKDVDYWTKHRFPKLSKKKTVYFVLYRNANNHLGWREINQGQFLLLERFKIGTSLAEACAYAEKQPPAVYEQIASHLQTWLQEWAQAGWLTLYSKQEF